MLFSPNKHWQLGPTTYNADDIYQTITVTYNTKPDGENFNDVWIRAVGPDIPLDEVVTINRVETSPPRYQVYISHRQMECIVRYHMDLCKPGLSQTTHALVGKPA